LRTSHVSLSCRVAESIIKSNSFVWPSLASYSSSVVRFPKTRASADAAIAEFSTRRRLQEEEEEEVAGGRRTDGRWVSVMA
jgi:hypothetical protein